MENIESLLLLYICCVSGLSKTFENELQNDSAAIRDESSPLKYFTLYWREVCTPPFVLDSELKVWTVFITSDILGCPIK